MELFREFLRHKWGHRISWMDYLLHGEYRERYLSWLSDRGEEPDDENAELFFIEKEKDLDYSLHIINDYYDTDSNIDNGYKEGRCGPQYLFGDACQQA